MNVIKSILKSDTKKEDKVFKETDLKEVGKFKSDAFLFSTSNLLLRMFEAYGQFCASHPWEMILVVLALVIYATSVTFMEPGLESIKSPVSNNSTTSDVLIVAIVSCLAITYIYAQFSKLRNLGSKYILGVTGVLTILFAFAFSATTIKFLGADIVGLSDAMPIFLLLVDLSQACTLAKFALSSKCQSEIISNMGQGMALVGPTLTLDTMVEVLVFGVGTISGVKTLQTVCCVGCLSLVANYFAFMTFYPACLAIVLELTGDHTGSIQIQQIAKVWQIDDENQKPNPVTQKVKMIMSAGLVLVHIHSRFASPSSSSSQFSSSPIDGAMKDEMMLTPGDVNSADMSFWQFMFARASGFSIDYLITLLVIIILSIKYTFNSDLENPTSGVPDPSEEVPGQGPGTRRPSKSVTFVGGDGGDHGGCFQENVAGGRGFEEVGVQTEDFSSITKSKFYIKSDSSDEDDDDVGGRRKKRSVDASTETSDLDCSVNEDSSSQHQKAPRTLNDCVQIYKTQDGPMRLTDDEVVLLVAAKQIPAHQLENALGNHTRGVHVRRKIISKCLDDVSALNNLPFLNYDYKFVHGACCENVIGYMAVPVGVAGPLLINGKKYHIPLATTEGCLVASVNRGCRVLSSGDGVTSIVTKDAMTRAPVVRFDTVRRASEVKGWLEAKENFELIAEAFNETSRFARLQGLQIVQISRNLHIRFAAMTGDAMGMNMLSKGCERALQMLQEKYFNDMQILSLSGNFCTDKKPSAVNWVNGRGKSVVAEAVVRGSVVRDVLKTDVDTLVYLNNNKNLLGSIAAGSIGGFNAQAANVVTAIYIATGQDPAQNVCSSNCLTVMEQCGEGDLYVSCTMPSIEVGTIGGGTILPPQAACLEMLGIRGSNPEKPGLNSSTLANVVCSAVVAGELSLMAALATGDLVKSHLKHNRSSLNMAPPPCVVP